MAITKVTSGLISADAASVDLNIDAGTLYIDATNNRVGVGDTSPSYPLDVAGIVSATEYYISGTEVLDHDGNYTTLLDPTAHVGLYLGGTGDQGNYYDNATHYFRTRGDAQQVVIDSTKLNIVTGALQMNGTVVIDTSRNLTNIGTITASGTISSSNSGTDGGQIRLTNTGGGSTWYWAARTTGLNLGELTVADGNIFIKNGGNVGIGTTDPTAPLDVRGNVGGGGMVRIIDSATESSIAYKISGATSATVGWVAGNANDDFFLYSYTLGSQAMTLKSSGNVGIGETSPETRLHVSLSNTGYTSVTGQTVALFERNGDCHVTIRSNAANHGSIKFADDGNSRGEIRYRHASGTDAMSIFTAGTERMRIDSNGGVVIGDTSIPQYTNLKVYEEHFGGMVNIGHSNTGGTFPKVSAIGMGSDAVSFTHSTNNGAVPLSGSAQIAAIQTASGGAPTEMVFYTTSGGSVQERMRIDASGNVGIGTNDPSGKLHILNTSGSTISSNYLLVEGSTADNSNYPGMIFKGGSLANFYPEVALTNGGLALGLNAGGHTSNYNYKSQIILQGADGSIALNTGTTTLVLGLKVDASQNVGIGTGSDGIGAKTKIKTNTSTNNWHLELTEDNNQDYTGREFSSRHVSMWVDATGNRNKIRIPYVAQSGAWRKYLIKYDFISVAYNSNTSIHAGGGTFAAHTLNSGNGGITDLHKFGNVASVSIDKTNFYFEINLTNAIPTGLGDATGVFLHLMVLEELNGTDLTGVDLV